MPDRQQSVITTRNNANVNVPRRTWTFDVTDSVTGTVLSSQSIRFPEDIVSLDAESLEELIALVLEFIARKRGV